MQVFDYLYEEQVNEADATHILTGILNTTGNARMNMTLHDCLVSVCMSDMLNKSSGSLSSKKRNTKTGSRVGLSLVVLKIVCGISPESLRCAIGQLWESILVNGDDNLLKYRRDIIVLSTIAYAAHTVDVQHPFVLLMIKTCCSDNDATIRHKYGVRTV